MLNEKGEPKFAVGDTVCFRVDKELRIGVVSVYYFDHGRGWFYRIEDSKVDFMSYGLYEKDIWK